MQHKVTAYAQKSEVAVLFDKPSRAVCSLETDGFEYLGGGYQRFHPTHKPQGQTQDQCNQVKVILQSYTRQQLTDDLQQQQH